MKWWTNNVVKENVFIVTDVSIQQSVSANKSHKRTRNVVKSLNLLFFKLRFSWLLRFSICETISTLPEGSRVWLKTKQMRNNHYDWASWPCVLYRRMQKKCPVLWWHDDVQRKWSSWNGGGSVIFDGKYYITFHQTA